MVSKTTAPTADTTPDPVSRFRVADVVVPDNPYTAGINMLINPDGTPIPGKIVTWALVGDEAATVKRQAMKAGLAFDPPLSAKVEIDTDDDGNQIATMTVAIKRFRHKPSAEPAA